MEGQHMETKIYLEDQSTFNDYVARHPRGSVLQTTNWGKLKTMTEWEYYPVAAVSDAGIEAAALILVRSLPGLGFRIFYSPRGPLYSSIQGLAQLVQGIKRLGRQKRAILWKMDPAIPAINREWESFAQEHKLVQVVDDSPFSGVQPKFVMDLDITAPLQDILANMKSKTRYNIRYAARRGVKVKKCRSKKELNTFYALLQETAERDGFTVRDLTYFEGLWDHLIEHGLAQLFLAYYEGIPLAGAIAFRLGSRAWYVYGASSNEHRNLQASHLMQWEMIKWAKSSGCRVYDFRGVSGEIDPQHPLYGLYRFKEGFGASLREYVGEFDCVLNRPLYRVWQAALKVRQRRRK